MIAIDDIDIRGFYKRIVDSVDFNEGEEDIYRLKKTRRED